MKIHIHHPRNGVVIFLVTPCVCLHVRLSVIQCHSCTITFESLDLESSFFGLHIHIHLQLGIQAKFLYEGHRIKVKVTVCYRLQGWLIQTSSKIYTVTDPEAERKRMFLHPARE